MIVVFLYSYVMCIISFVMMTVIDLTCVCWCCGDDFVVDFVCTSTGVTTVYLCLLFILFITGMVMMSVFADVAVTGIFVVRRRDCCLSHPLINFFK